VGREGLASAKICKAQPENSQRVKKGREASKPKHMESDRLGWGKERLGFGERGKAKQKKESKNRFRKPNHETGERNRRDGGVERGPRRFETSGRGVLIRKSEPEPGKKRVRWKVEREGRRDVSWGRGRPGGCLGCDVNVGGGLGRGGFTKERRSLSTPLRGVGGWGGREGGIVRLRKVVSRKNK